MRTTTFDFTPLFRTTIGFDRISRALEAASRVDDSALSYPPYNIEQVSEDHYCITMAVAGFGAEDIDVIAHEGVLTVKSLPAKNGQDDGTYLHRGIAARAFERRFQLADYIEVKSAELENGLLSVELERQVPDEMKPRSIAIGTPSRKRIKGQAA
jgi:molecular chaperone IbpA